MNNRPLLQLCNIGKTIAESLQQVGIHDEADLKKTGAVKAYQLLQAIYPERTLPVCYYLYILEGALQDRDWRALSRDEKNHMLAQLKR
ncbi:TfoX/Sxy family DNA transformation protein [Marinicella sp. W31]|uniref:TfoX/Sxy family DNA transformation protein n=1 Tax=Marinicella sp. W31 TaxID=3023713 RepID=UPI003756854B